MVIENIKPEDIEKRSFEIIGDELSKKGMEIDERYAHIIKRCIHTSADFDYAETLYFSDGAVEAIKDAIVKGCTIITDTNMVQAGINKKKLEGCGGKVYTFIGADDVAEEAGLRGVTRSYVAMEKAMLFDSPVIFAIGNAPTALISIEKMYLEKKIDPVAVIGTPVGFVNVLESKEIIIDSGMKCIINKGRKGGSNIAAAIVNAILYSI